MAKREEQIVFWRQGSHENLEGHEMTTQSQIPWQW